MINIGLDGDDEVMMKVLSLPQVPRTGEYLYMSNKRLYRVKMVYWSEEQNTLYEPPVRVVLGLEFLKS